MTWTGKERVAAVLSGEIPDRVPVFDYLIHDEILEHFGGKTIAVGDEEAMIRACSNCLDLCHPIGVPFEPGETLLPDGTRRVYERWTSWDIPPAGMDLDCLVKKIEREIEEKEVYKPEAEKINAFKEHAGKANQWAGDMTYIHIGTACALLPGTIEQGIYLYADYPELVERWARAQDRAMLQWIDAIADAADSPVAINWNDIAIKGSLMYPVPLLEKLLYPTLAELCDLYHSRGMKLIFHSDGNVNQAMDALIRCGIDGFNPLELSAGMDYRHFKEKYGKKTVLVGGMDAVEILSFADPDTVAAETRRILKAAGKDGGLIIGSSSGELDNSMPYDNVMAYFKTVWEYGIYR